MLLNLPCRCEEQLWQLQMFLTVAIHQLSKARITQRIMRKSLHVNWPVRNLPKEQWNTTVHYHRAVPQYCASRTGSISTSKCWAFLHRARRLLYETQTDRGRLGHTDCGVLDASSHRMKANTSIRKLKKEPPSRMMSLLDYRMIFENWKQIPHLSSIVPYCRKIGGKFCNGQHMVI